MRTRMATKTETGMRTETRTRTVVQKPAEGSKEAVDGVVEAHEWGPMMMVVRAAYRV